MAASNSEAEVEEYAGGREESSSFTHLPYAPPSEVVDSTSTIDPSYIIHLIRQLLPRSFQSEENSQGSISVRDAIEESHSQPTCDTTDVSVIGNSDYISESLNNCKFKLPFRHENEAYGENDTAVDEAMVSEFEQNEYNEGQVDCSRDSIASLQGDLWEESGCILWDLSTDKSNAELMVENFLLDVIMGSFSVSTSFRMTEICLGILANLACHEVPRNLMTSSKGLIDAVIAQFFIMDASCLYELFRLLNSMLQSGDAISWAKALEPVKKKIISIPRNILNPKLLEMSIELLLSIVDNQQVADLLLPSLMHFGLPNLLVDLLESEVGQMTNGNACGRDNILDTILRVCEVLSFVDRYSEVLFSNKKIFQYACCVVKHSDKDEIDSSCVTATVVIGNLVSDEPNLADEISKDLAFLHGLLNMLSLVSDDSEASDAFWSLFSKLLIRVPELMSPSSTRQFAPLLADRSVLIAEALESHLGDAESCKKRSNAKLAALQGMIMVLEKYIEECFQDQQVPEDVSRAHKLFKDCYQRSKSRG